MAAKQGAAAEVSGGETIGELAASIRELADSQRKAKPTSYAAWLERHARPVKLKQKFFMNGINIPINQLTDEQVTLVNQLKPGRFNKRKWEIIKRRDRSFDFRYPNKTVEHRMENQSVARDLTDMLKLMITEAEAQKTRRKAGEDEYDDE